MRSSFRRSALHSPACQHRCGGARRHPHPSIDVPRAGRQAPAPLSSTVDTVRSTHTNRSPINPVHFTSRGCTAGRARCLWCRPTRCRRPRGCGSWCPVRGARVFRSSANDVARRVSAQLPRVRHHVGSTDGASAFHAVVDDRCPAARTERTRPAAHRAFQERRPLRSRVVYGG
jgi:hypothetical protein